MKTEVNIGYQGETTISHQKKSDHVIELFTNIFLVLSALTALWAVSCLVVGLQESGMVGLLKAWVTAVIGG